MRDLKDNVVIICSIENFDPMGIHTGDSITVAPCQTLTDREYQKLRDASVAIIRKVGVQTGGSNIQFAVNPDDGRIVIIEMNPRVSRSSALASKATGFPIAKIAASLAVGYTLDEIPNEITRKTMASFEPTLDYVVVKLPRWAFEKFNHADPILTTQMKSVGEVMAIGRTFKEALMKGIHSLELKSRGLFLDNISKDPAVIRSHLQTPTWDRIFYVAAAIEAGISFHDIHQMTSIDPWFLAQMDEILHMSRSLQNWDDVTTEQTCATRKDLDYRMVILHISASAPKRRSGRFVSNLSCVPCSNGSIRVPQSLKHTHLIFIPHMNAKVNPIQPIAEKF